MNKLLEMITDMFDKKHMSDAALKLFKEMVSDPTKDYCTFEEISAFGFDNDAAETKKILSELMQRNFLIHPNGREKVFAVNKAVLPKFEEE